LIIFTNSNSKNSLAAAERLRKKIESIRLPQLAEAITISGGLACFHGQKIMELIDAADKKMYEAKGQGRNKIVCAPCPSSKS